MSAIRPPIETWIRSNLKLFIAMMVVGALLVCVIIAFGVMALFKSSDAYQLGFDKAKNDPVVIDAIGTPVEAGMFMGGNIRVSGPAGNAELSIPVHGPKGAGTVYLHAQKSLGEWTLTALVFENGKTQHRTDLLHKDEDARVAQ